MEPGRPHSPSLNAARTRPEAQEFALKNKGTNDWFRHDGKNVELPAPPAVRQGSKTAKAVAVKNKGESDQWFAPQPNGGVVNGNGPPRSPSGGATRCRTAEAKRNFEKIKGKDEAWYKHEENQNFVSPRPKSRLADHQAETFKDRATGSASDWYKDEQSANATNGHGSPQKGRTTVFGQENASKLRPAGTPVWASHDQNGGDVTDGPRAASRLGADAQEYVERNKGSASEWFKTAENGQAEEMTSPRRGSEECQSYAQKYKGDSSNWFNHDANRNYFEPTRAPRCRSSSARDMIERSQGQLDRVMKHEENNNYNSPRETRIKPEAQEFARRNVAGMMGKYLDQDGNQGYESTRPEPRIKPEARDAVEKNKGVMGECMEGYLPSPRQHEARRVKPEAEQNAQRNRGMAGSVISGDAPGSARKHPRVTGVAEQYAERNKGTMGDLMKNYGQLSITGQPIKHRSAEAEANAARWRGSEVGGIFNYDS